MKTFRARILALLLALVVAIQLATIAALVMLTQREAQIRAREDLQAGGRVVARIMQTRAEQLRGAVQVLVADFGFKEAVTSGEQDTIRSALDNSAARIDADLAAFFDEHGRVLASSMPELKAIDGLEATSQDEELSGSDVLYRTINRKPYLLVLAPVRAPAPIGWAAIGF